MPDNLIIAPDGLVKVEPSRCIFADGWRYAKPLRVASIATVPMMPAQRRNGNATQRASGPV